MTLLFSSNNLRLMSIYNNEYSYCKSFKKSSALHRQLVHTNKKINTLTKLPGVETHASAHL